jgi:hypothetical protein
MRTHGRCQYNRTLPGRKAILLVLLLVAGGPLCTSALATEPQGVQNPGGNIAEWDNHLRRLLQLLLPLLEQFPPPRLEDPVVTWCIEFNLGYTTVGLRQNLSIEEREQAAADIFDTLEHLDLNPGGLDPEVYEATVDTLISMLQDLGIGGPQ